jgi:HD-like signal output (HDOD) protein
VSLTTLDAAQEFRDAFARTAIGELSFPTSLDASQRVLQAIEKPDLALSALARILVAEPLLSAKVMRLANSVALNHANKTVRDLQQAVLCVGFDITKALAMVLVLEQLRQAQRHSGCRELANRLWERSIHIAALAYVLTKKLTRLNADEVMFAGVVHDLGRFYLLARSADYPALQDDLGVLAQTINDLAGDATLAVLGKLKLPASVIDTVLAARAERPAQSPVSAGDILAIAGIVSPRRDPLAELDPRAAWAPAPELPPGFDQQTIADLIAESGTAIYSIVVALES